MSTSKITSVEELVKEWGDYWYDPTNWATVATGVRKGVINDDNFWKYREMVRLYHGAYGRQRIHLDGLMDIRHTTVLDCIQEMEDMYPFVDPDSEMPMIHFTPNESYGKQDRRVIMKAGKFFRNYIPGLTDDVIKQLANEFNAMWGPIEVQFSEGKDIEAIYCYQHRGFTSCMDGTNHFFDCDGHPAQVYNSPDIAIAWVGTKHMGDEWRTGELYARALINKNRKEFSTVYGDERLKDKLRQMGYSSGDLDGCRIRKIWHDKSEDLVVMPYIDGGGDFSEYDNDYFRVGGGEYCAEDTYGLTSLYGYSCRCGLCGVRCDEYDLHYVEAEGCDVCDDCIADNYVMAHYRSYSEDWIPTQDAVYLDDYDEWWDSSCEGEFFHWSEHTQSYIKDEDAVYSEPLETYIYADLSLEVEILDDDEDVLDTVFVPDDYVLEDNMRAA